MIAPARFPQPPEADDPRVRRARRRAGELLRAPTDERAPLVEPTPSWQAWLMTGWIVLVVIAFFIAMIRSLA